MPTGEATQNTSRENGNAISRGSHSKIPLTLSHALTKKLDRARAEAGLSRPQWIRGCIANTLGREAVFPKEETKALVHVRQELRRIGIALRRAASDLELAGYPETAEEMCGLYMDARLQLEAVRAALEGNLAYWGRADGR
jgi:hypothetical protein